LEQAIGQLEASTDYLRELQTKRQMRKLQKKKRRKFKEVLE